MCAYNVMDYGATGDCSVTDNEAIQSALDACETAGGGVVLFPAGTYLIDTTILLPNKVFMHGEGGTVFGTSANDIGADDPEDFINQANTVIKLDDGANCDMLAQKESNGDRSLFQSGIDGFVFWGNKDNQGTGPYHGINIIDIDYNTPPYQFECRGHSRFRNILIYDVKGNGFYSGLYNHELFLDEIYAVRCDLNGITVSGTDTKLSRCGGGFNLKSGIVLRGGKNSGSALYSGGAFRCYDLDGFCNDEYGIEIHDCVNIEIFGMVGDRNKKSGLYISNGAENINPSQIQIFRGLFECNSSDSNNTYADVLIDSSLSGAGPSNIVFNSCLFRGKVSGNKPKYAIWDSSDEPSNNLVTCCGFAFENYCEGIINNMGIYSFKENINLDNGQVIDSGNLPFTFKDCEYDIQNSDCYVAMGTSTAATTRYVALPLISKTPVGKVFYITKSDSHHPLTVLPSTGDTIDGEVNLTSRFEVLMIINAGSCWYSTKIS